MDRMTTVDEIEQEIDTVMREQGVDRIEAQTIVGLRRGEFLSDDILVLRPLSDKQRRWLGLGRSIHEVVAEARAKRNGDASPIPDAVERPT
jgi:hypothetical protein